MKAEIKKKIEEAAKKRINKPSTNPGVDGAMKTLLQNATTHQKPMTTGGERINKPPQTKGTQILISAIPFFNLDIQSDSIVQTAIDLFFEIEPQNRELYKSQTKPKEWTPNDISHLREVLKYSRLFLQIYAGKESAIPVSSEVCTWLVRGIRLAKPIYHLKPGEFKNKFGFSFDCGINPSGLVKRLHWKLSNALCDGFSDIEKRGKKRRGNATFFIWACPRCGKIFEKKNNRQIWCSDSCRGSQNTPILR